MQNENISSQTAVKASNFTIDNFFLIAENVFTERECSEVCEMYEDVRHLSKKNKRIVEHAEKVINEVQLNGLGGKWDALTDKLRERVTPHIDKYLATFKTIDSKSYQLDNVALWEQKGMEYAPLHFDKEWIVGENGADQYRNFLCLLYLNEDYEGGEIIFPVQGKVIKPKTGMLLIFPTSLMFPHQTTPAIGNDRKLLRLTYLFDKASL